MQLVLVRQHYYSSQLAGQMHARKGSAYMERAIDKASHLIELLTRENEELKQDNLRAAQERRRAQSQRDSLEQKASNLHSQMAELQSHLQGLKLAHEKIQKGRLQVESKLNQKTENNKNLHNKLGEFSAKNSELAKVVEKQKKTILALENENQYLVRLFNEQSQKQNSLQNCHIVAEEQLKREVVTVDRAKQAFARKCEELRAENIKLRAQIVNLQETVAGLQANAGRSQQLLSRCTSQDRELRYLNDSLAILITSTLKVKPEQGLAEKMQQIKAYLNYRLQHIASLLSPVLQLLGDTRGFGANMEALKNVVGRLDVYLSQLTK